MSEKFKVAGVQMDVALGDVPANLAAVESHVRQAAAEGARLVVFPECALTGYCFASREEAWPHAQPVPGPATETLSQLCRELDVFIATGMLEQDGDRLFNAAVLVGPEGVLGRYRKIHLPFLGIDRFVTPGDGIPGVFPCGPVRVGLHICYDGSFPETARSMAIDGADLILLPTNWPPGSEYMAQYLVNARASENHVYFFAVNRVGEERGFKFIGKSRLAHPSGARVAELPHDQSGILYGEIDVEVARNKHLVRVPGEHEIDRLADRRPSMYSRLVAPTGEIPLVIRRRHAPCLEESKQQQLFQQMWAPWRLAYVADAKRTDASTDPDFIARAAASDADRENLVIDRTEKTITLLNRFPYNNGHLMVAPIAAKARLDELTAEEHLECMQQVTKMTRLLEQHLNADGVNVGLNLGGAAGAGLPCHLHWHVLPRWFGDTNFMPVFSGVKVIPQSLDALWELLSAAAQSDSD